MENSVLLFLLFVFTLAVCLGFEMASKPQPSLRIPFLSGSNIISGAVVVAAVFAAGLGEGGRNDFAAVLGGFAVAFAAVKVVGSFSLTNRTLDESQKKTAPPPA